jgi:hypothetical protein
MFKPFTIAAPLAALLAFAGLAQTGHAQWVDYETMIKDAVAKQNEVVRVAVRNGREIVEQNMHDPRIQQMYRAHRMQGGQMTLEQFAYWYAATAGGTNVKGYYDNEADIAHKEAAAAKAYRDHVNTLWGEVKEHRDGVNDRIARGRGDNLSGDRDYYNPTTDRTERLPYTAPAGDVETDYYGGRRTMHTDGSYEYTTPNGWNYPMFPLWSR